MMPIDRRSDGGQPTSNRQLGPQPIRRAVPFFVNGGARGELRREIGQMLRKDHSAPKGIEPSGALPHFFSQVLLLWHGDSAGLKDDGAPPFFSAGRRQSVHACGNSCQKNRDPHRRFAVGLRPDP